MFSLVNFSSLFIGVLSSILMFFGCVSALLVRVVMCEISGLFSIIVL